MRLVVELPPESPTRAQGVPEGPPSARKLRREVKRQAVEAQRRASVRIQAVWRGKSARDRLWADEERDEPAPSAPSAERALLHTLPDAAKTRARWPREVVVDVREPPAPAKPAKAAAEPDADGVAAAAAPAGARARLRAAAPCIAACWTGCALCGCYAARAIELGATLLQTAPAKGLQAAYGLLLCFFGGPFAVSFAAVEAFRAMGLRQLRAEAAVLAAAWERVEAAGALDDQADADGDGVADVAALRPRALLARKAAVLAGAVAEPARVQRAVGALLTAWFGALATLRIRFARAAALALGVARLATPPLTALLARPLGRLLGPRHAQWAPVLVETLAQAAAAALAWPFERGVSAGYSALGGGLLAGRCLLELGLQLAGSARASPALRAAAARLGGPDGTVADELAGYALCVAGFCYQLASGFELAWPLSALLLPLLLVEWGLAWQLTWLT